MDMRLDKAWQYRTTGRIHHFVRFGINVIPHFCNAALANQHVTAHDGIPVVHRHNGAAFDENRFAHKQKSGPADYARIGEGL